MRQLLFILSILIPSFVFSQIPNINPRNIQLLYQTTGDGIVWRGGANIDYTPTSRGNAWMHLDTVNNKLYSYVQGQWSLVKAGGVTDVYMGNDTLYITTSDTVFYTVITPDSLQYNNTTQILSVRNGNSVTLAMNTDTTLSGNNTLASKLRVNNTYVPLFKDTLTTLATKANVALSLSAADTIKYIKYTDTVSTIATKANLTLKLNAADTASLSNRINLKLNAADTVKYVKYVDTLTTIATKAELALKLNSADTMSLSNRIDTKLDMADTTSVILTAQQKQLAYIKNETGSPLTRGQVVYVSGASGDNKLVRLASSSSEATSSKTFGLVSDATIASGSNGYVITFGLLEGVNTDTFQAGAVLYLHTVSGQITDVKPVAPLHMVVIGFCVRVQQNNGAIFVKIQNGFELDELHDVSVVGLAAGKVLKYNGTLWAPADDNDSQLITLTGDVTGSGTGTFTTTLANSGVTAGTYNNSATTVTPLIIDSKGRITGTGTPVTITPAFSSITSKPTTLSGYGITDAVPSSRTITINGTSFDLSENRSWTINSMVYPGAGIAVSTGNAWGPSIVDNSTNWNTAYTDRLKWDGGSTDLNAATGRTSLGATTIGSNLFTLTNPSAVTFPRFNADNTVSALSASDMRTALGAGTVTQVNALTIGTAGTNINSTVDNNTTTPTITLNIPTASATNRGALSSTDWTIFNNKQAQLNGTGFVKVSGTTVSYDNNTYLTSEVDGNVSNEGVLGVGEGSSTTAVITSNTSGASGVTIAQGTGIAVTETTSANGGTITITNSAPDQTIVLTGSGATTVASTYPSFTIGSQNLYTADGDLSGNRIVRMGSKDLTFSLSNFEPTTDSMNIALSTASGLRITNTGSTVLPQFTVTSISQSKQPVVSLVRSMNANGDKNLTAYDPVTNGITLGAVEWHGAYSTSATGLSSYINAQATNDWSTDNNNYSKLIFATKGNVDGFVTEKMEIGDNGQIRFNKYVPNSFTGTRVSFLGVDNSGNVINTSPTTLSGYGITDAISTTTVQDANKVLAGPTSGVAQAPTFRTLQDVDIPSLNASKITSGTLPVARGGTNVGSFTANGILYASATNQVATSGNLTYNGSTLNVQGSVAGGSFGALTLTNLTNNAAGVSTIISMPVFNGTSGSIIESVGNSVDGYSLILRHGQQTGRIRMRINDNSNNPVEVFTTSLLGVGFGETSPSARLHVAANVTGANLGVPIRINGGSTLAQTPQTGSIEFANNNLYFTPISGSANRNILAQVSGQTPLTTGSIPFASTNGYLTQNNSSLFWDNTNNRLGIGTNTPSSQLNIYNTSQDATILMDGSSAYNQNFHFFNNLYGITKLASSATINIKSGGRLIFSTNDNPQTEKMRITETGNVGIGTATPSTTLEVTGRTTFRNNTADLNGGVLGSELLTSANWTTTGWTGDFTTGFTHSTGNTSVLSNTLAALNGTYYQIAYTVTGRTAGTFVLSFGGYTSGNLSATGAVGPLATNTGNLTITPTLDFNGTIVLSIKAISASDPSIQFLSNSGEGSNEIRISNGVRNVFMGLLAGSRNLYNSDIRGAYNTFVGSEAGRNNTTGTENTFIGAISGRGNTIGAGNTFFGFSAGRDNTSGNSNAFFGTFAGSKNTTANNNTFFGNSAGLNNTTGSAGVFLGVSSGQFNQTGSSNIFIGASAGNNNTTGNRNLVIGNDITLPTVSGDDFVTIKNIIFATGASGSGTNIAGNVGIGVNNPASRLVVKGIGANAGTTAFNVTNSNNTSMFSVRDDGRVGVNTNDPKMGFHYGTGVGGFDGNANQFLFRSNNYYSGSDQVSIKAGFAHYVDFNNYTGDFTIQTSSAAATAADQLITLVPRFILTNSGNLSITGALSANSLSLTNPLPVSSGGTGRGNLEANKVLVGNGTGGVLAPFELTYSATDPTKLAVNGWIKTKAISVNTDRGGLADGGLFFNRFSGDPFFAWFEDDQGIAQIRGSRDGGDAFLYISDITGFGDKYFTVRTLGTNIGNVGISTGQPTSNLEVAQLTTSSGTVSITNGSTIVTGSGTQFTNTFKVGDAITISGQTRTITAIANDVSLTVDANYTTTASNLTYTLTGGTRFVVRGNGNVGIGTANPQNRLDVEGAVAIGAGYSGSATAPQDGLIVEGNVGIGTSSVTANRRLDVNGEVRIRDLDVNVIPTLLVGADAQGNLDQVALSGLTIDNGTLKPTAGVEAKFFTLTMFKTDELITNTLSKDYLVIPAEINGWCFTRYSGRIFEGTGTVQVQMVDVEQSANWAGQTFSSTTYYDKSVGHTVASGERWRIETGSLSSGSTLKGLSITLVFQPTCP